jgi:hypothetical protein
MASSNTLGGGAEPRPMSASRSSVHMKSRRASFTTEASSMQRTPSMRTTTSVLSGVSSDQLRRGSSFTSGRAAISNYAGSSAPLDDAARDLEARDDAVSDASGEALRDAFRDDVSDDGTGTGCASLLRIPDVGGEALDQSAFFIFAPHNIVRIFMFNIVRHWVFETIIIILILVNCVFLALDDPLQPEPAPYQFTVDVFFAAAFTLEMLMKMFAIGVFAHKGAYLRNSWNILDFVIVILSYLNFLPAFGNYTAFRTLRVLRPLRSMNAVRGLQILVVGLIASMKGLVHVGLLTFFTLLCFAILGVQLFGGNFRYRCWHPATGVVDEEAFCRPAALRVSEDGYWGYSCEPEWECLRWENPSYGLYHYDNVLYGMLTTFTIITFEDWTIAFNITIATTGTLAFFYHFALIVMCGYFIPNLALAVINDEFVKAQEAADEADRLKAEAQSRAEYLKGLTGLRIGNKVATPPPGTSAVLVVSDDALDKNPLSLDSEGGLPPAMLDNGDLAPPPVTCWMRWHMFRDAMHMFTEGFHRLDSPFPPPPKPAPASEMDGADKQAESAANGSVAVVGKLFDSEDGSALDSDDGKSGDGGSSKGPPPADDDEPPTTPFMMVIIVCILLNTVLLSSQHYGQPDWLTEVQSVANKVLTAIFALEMVMRLTGLGFYHYCKDPFNDLDGTVVIFSIIEMSLAGSNTISVFRALRLLRILKLLRSFPSLRAIIIVTLRAMTDTAYLLLIVCLYLFIVALIGQSFFGGKLTAVQAVSGNRINYDNFILSFYSAFQIMTFDGWVATMYEAMASTSNAAVMYFVGQTIIGNYVLLSLFLSILLSSFDSLPGEDNDDLENENLLVIKLFDMEGAKKIFGRGGLKEQSGGYVEEVFVHPNTTIKLSDAASREVNRAENYYKTATAMELDTTMQSGLDGNFCSSLSDIPLPEKEVKKEKKEKKVDRPVSAGAQSAESLSQFVVLGMEAKKKEKVVIKAPVVCDKCGHVMEVPLDPAPLVQQPSLRQLHKVHCKFSAVRKARQAVLGSLITLVEFYIETDQAPKISLLDLVLGQAWQTGLLLNEAIDDFAGLGDAWQRLLAELREEMLILELRLNEEQLGRSLIAFAMSNVPTDHKTNGGYALFLFSPVNPIRVLTSRLIHHEWFDRVVLLLIACSSISMAFDNPLDDPEGDKRKTLDILTIFFTAAFTLEMLLKWVALGVVFFDGAYFRDSWNCLDGFIVFVSLLGYAIVGVDVSFLRVFRTLRALRPLRVINRNRGLKMVVRTLLESVKGIMNVSLICLISFIIFGILAVQLFGGKFQSCTDPEVNTRAECTGSYFDAVHGNRSFPRTWRSEPRNFDHIGNSILTLFEVGSGEWWGPVLYRSIDACSTEIGPQRECALFAGFFFIIFYAVTGFFLINLFVGVVIHNFNLVKEQMDGSQLMSSEQKLWVSTQQLILNFRPSIAMMPKTDSALAQWLHRKLVGRTSFEVIVGVGILANIVVIGIDHYGISAELANVLEIMNYFFVAFFVVEALLKLACFRLRYFRSGWNQFDFFLVLISLLGVGLALTGGGIGFNVGVLRVFRIFRILRVLRLVKSARKIRVLLETLWYSLPSMINIGTFILLVDFIYGVLGVDIFAKLKIPADANVLDNNMVNFRSLDRALMMLFRFQTIEEWDGAMHDCMLAEPYCTGDECGTPNAWLYFVTYIIITAFVITNLLIAIILDNFETTMRLDASALKMMHLNRFVDIWSEFDEDATMTIPTVKFAYLLARLAPPRGLSRVQSRRELLTRTAKYRIPEHGGFIHFIETLIPLSRVVKEEDTEADKLILTEREIRENETMWRLNFPGLMELPVLRYREQMVTVDQYYTSAFISAAYRARRAHHDCNRMRFRQIQEVMRHCDATGTPYEDVPYLARHMEHAAKTSSRASLHPPPLRIGYTDPAIPARLRRYGANLLATSVLVSPPTHVMDDDAQIDFNPTGTEEAGNELSMISTTSSYDATGADPDLMMQTSLECDRQDADMLAPRVVPFVKPEAPPAVEEADVDDERRARRYESKIAATERAEDDRRRRVLPLKRSSNRKHVEEDDEVGASPMKAKGRYVDEDAAEQFAETERTVQVASAAKTPKKNTPSRARKTGRR